MKTTHAHRLAGLLGLTLMAFGCKHSSSTTEPNPTIRVSLSRSAIAIDQGNSDQLTVTVTGAGGFSGAAAVTVEGAPAGVTGSISGVSTTNAVTTATVTIAVAATTAPGSYTITVRASGSGVTAVTASLSLTVNPVGIALAATAVSAPAGGNGISTITITRTNFTGAVALAAEGLPTGVTATFNPVSATGNTSALTLDVAGTVAAGVYNLTVRGTAAGLPAATAPVTLTVTAPQGGFTLAVAPVSIGVSRGGGAAALVTITRTGGFSGAVAFAVSGAPAGLSTAVPGTSTGNGVSVRLGAAASVAVGRYPLTITGTAPGLPNQTALLDAVVNDPNVSLDFAGCGTGTPIWLALQDGDGAPWVEQLPGSTGGYLSKVTGPKVGVAFVTAGFGSSHSLLLQYSSAAELQTTRGDVLCGNPAGSGRTATISTVNLTASQVAFVSFGDALRTFTSTLPGGSLSDIAPGPHDLVAHIQQNSGGFSAADRLIIRRDLDPAEGGSLGAPLDFTSAEAVAPSSATIMVTGLEAGEQLNGAGTQLLTGSSCHPAPLWGQSFVPGATFFTAYGVPSAIRQPNDTHLITVNAVIPGQAFREVTEFAALLVDRTIVLPTHLPVPDVSSLPGPYARLKFEFATTTAAADVVTANYGIGTGAAVFMTATAGWLGGTDVLLAMPDFSESADWNNAWGPTGSNPLAWTITATGASVGCAEGRIVGLSRNGTH